MDQNKSDQSISFEQAFERLEKIVSQLDQGELKLDDLEEKFEEGMNLVTYCAKRLEQVERKVHLLIENSEEGLKREPFDSEDE